MSDVAGSAENPRLGMWIGMRLGLRSGLRGGLVAGVALGLLAAVITLFTGIEFGPFNTVAIFLCGGIYGLTLGVLGGALGGLIGGAIIGTTRVPDNLLRAGGIAGAATGVLLVLVFFGAYSWLNTGKTPVGIFFDLAPVALVAAIGGAVGGVVAGKRFASQVEGLAPLLHGHDDTESGFVDANARGR